MVLNMFRIEPKIIKKLNASVHPDMINRIYIREVMIKDLNDSGVDILK